MMRMLLLGLVGMIVAGCAAGGASGTPARITDPQAVLDRTWLWEATVTPAEKITAAAPERYTLRLAPEGRAQALFDCNRGGGDFKISPGKISFGPMMATRMACPPDTQDFVFMRDLSRVASFFVEGGKLYLELGMDGGTMRFRTE